ncbi:hypothetical protein D3C81_2247390 [compost metagenome]
MLVPNGRHVIPTGCECILGCLSDQLGQAGPGTSGFDHQGVIDNGALHLTAGGKMVLRDEGRRNRNDQGTS